MPFSHRDIVDLVQAATRINQVFTGYLQNPPALAGEYATVRHSGAEWDADAQDLIKVWNIVIMVSVRGQQDTGDEEAKLTAHAEAIVRRLDPYRTHTLQATYNLMPPQSGYVILEMDITERVEMVP